MVQLLNALFFVLSKQRDLAVLGMSAFSWFLMYEFFRTSGVFNFCSLANFVHTCRSTKLCINIMKSENNGYDSN